MKPLDDHTFRALFLEQRSSILQFLRRLTRSETEAEDLLQDTFLTVWRKRDQFEGRGAVEGFLRKAAYRVFLNHRQREERRRKLDARHSGAALENLEPSPDHALECQESVTFLLQRLEHALATVPEEPRRVFVLFRFEGMSLHEIAELTGAPVKTVETRLRRATELLARKLRPLQEHL